MRWLNVVLRRNNPEPSALRAAETCLDRGDLESARRLANEVLQGPASHQLMARAHRVLGEAAARIGDLDEAIRHYKAAVAQDPSAALKGTLAWLESMQRPSEEEIRKRDEQERQEMLTRMAWDKERDRQERWRQAERARRDRWLQKQAAERAGKHGIQKAAGWAKALGGLAGVLFFAVSASVGATVIVRKLSDNDDLAMLVGMLAFGMTFVAFVRWLPDQGQPPDDWGRQ
jgi:tetratricopeptide (TPR) repeat protein